MQNKKNKYRNLEYLYFTFKQYHAKRIAKTLDLGFMNHAELIEEYYIGNGFDRAYRQEIANKAFRLAKRSVLKEMGLAQ